MTKSTTRNLRNQSQISLSDQENISRELVNLRYEKSKTTVNKNIEEIQSNIKQIKVENDH